MYSAPFKKPLTAGIIVIALFAFGFIGARIVSNYYLDEGISYIGEGKYIEAEQSLFKSIRFYPWNPETHFYLGKISLGIPNTSFDYDLITGRYYPDAKYGEAAERFEKAIGLGLEGKNPELYKSAIHDAGISYWMEGGYDQAVEKFLKKIEIDPDRAFLARRNVAMHYYYRANKPEEGYKILLGAITPERLLLQPVGLVQRNLFKIYALLAGYAEYFGEKEEMERYAELVLKSAPKGAEGSPSFQDGLAFLALAKMRKGDVAGAKDDVKKAEEISGVPGAYSCVLSRIYLLSGRSAVALQTAISTRTNEPRVQSFCLRTLWGYYESIGNKEEAANYIEKFIKTTSSLPTKDIFVTRELERAKEALENIKP